MTGTDPFTDDDPTWVNMATQVSGGTFTFDGVTYTAPAAGRTASACSTSATRASAARSATTSTATATRPAAADTSRVLWNPTTNKVWVDTNQNTQLRRRDRR